MAETSKAMTRRRAEGFFDRFMQGDGIDIGCGNDPVTPDCWRYDKEQGDAVFMRNCPVKQVRWVYSSHCLEHLYHPEVALGNWWNLIEPGGYLILIVPHRDLYEKKQLLPSRFNGDHKLFFLPDRDEAPHTYSLVAMVRRAIPDAELRLLQVCDEGWKPLPPEVHPTGEFSIEGVWRKP